MQDFAVDDATYPRSIGFDATERDGLVVTVGVALTRTQEAHLLDVLYRKLNTEGYLPFRTKSRDLSLTPNKIDEVLQNCNGEVGICIHEDSVKLPFAEATHSAIILDALAIPTNKTIVIVDGDNSKSKLFQHATSGVELTPPPIVYCTQSEMYYPHLLLADLIAGRIADEILARANAVNNIKKIGPIEVIKETTNGSSQWGQAYHAAARQRSKLLNREFEQRYASSFQERVTCWFNGWFGYQNARPPASNNVPAIVGRLNSIECTDIAQWIAEQQ